MVMPLTGNNKTLLFGTVGPFKEEDMKCIKGTCQRTSFTLGQRDRRLIGYDWTPLCLPAELPAIYHPGVEIDYWAGFYGSSPGQLRSDTQSIIRACHRAALFDFKASGKQPDVYELGLGSLRVYYTVESHAIVVRGYSPNLPPHQLDEAFAGGIYTEFDW
jgi:hypothetical protein